MAVKALIQQLAIVSCWLFDSSGWGMCHTLHNCKQLCDKQFTDSRCKLLTCAPPRFSILSSVWVNDHSNLSSSHGLSFKSTLKARKSCHRPEWKRPVFITYSRQSRSQSIFVLYRTTICSTWIVARGRTSTSELSVCGLHLSNVAAVTVQKVLINGRVSFLKEIHSFYFCLQWIVGPNGVSEQNDSETASLFHFIIKSGFPGKFNW